MPGTETPIHLGELEPDGSRVTVVERMAKLLPREDDDVAAEIQAILEREGVEIRTGAECMALSKENGGVAVQLECQAGAPVAQGSHVLLAVGRQPNTHDLGLAAAAPLRIPRGTTTRS